MRRHSFKRKHFCDKSSEMYYGFVVVVVVVLLPVLPGGDVAHGSVDSDGATVETVDYFAHLFPVFVVVFPPLAGSLLLEHSDNPQWSPTCFAPMQPWRWFTNSSNEMWKDKYLWRIRHFSGNREAVLNKPRKILSGDLQKLFPREFSITLYIWIITPGFYFSSPYASLHHICVVNTPSSGSWFVPESVSEVELPACGSWAECWGTTRKWRRSGPGLSWCSPGTQSVGGVSSRRSESKEQNVFEKCFWYFFFSRPAVRRLVSHVQARGPKVPTVPDWMASLFSSCSQSSVENRKTLFILVAHYYVLLVPFKSVSIHKREQKW